MSELDMLTAKVGVSADVVGKRDAAPFRLPKRLCTPEYARELLNSNKVYFEEGKYNPFRHDVYTLCVTGGN